MSPRARRWCWAAPLLLAIGLGPQAAAQEEPADRPSPTIESLGEPKRPQHAEAGADEMYIDFQDAPLQDVLQAIALQTGLNFDLDPNAVNQKVTIIAHHPIPKAMALDLLETVLAAPTRNLQIVKTLNGNLYRIISRAPGQGSDKMEISSGRGQPLTGFDRFAIHVVKVEYADVTKVGDLLKKVGSEIADITAYPQSGLLILKDSTDGIRNMLSLLEVIDVPGTGTSVEIFPLQWTRAETLAEQVSQVLLGESTGAQGGQPGGPAIVRRSPRVDPGTGQPVSEVIGQDEQVLRVVPDERLNALIVVASEAMMGQVRTLVDALDTANDPDTNNIHHRRLQNADGEKLAETLESIIGSSTPSQASGAGGGGGGAQNGAVKAFERDVTVSFYEPTNSLLILASPQDFKLIDDIITQLDVPQRMVSVEVVIMGVTINDNASLGVESALLSNKDFFALSNTVSIANILAGGGAGAAAGLLSLAGPGGSIGILDGTTEIGVGGETVTVPNVPLLLRALETVTDVDVLTRPNLMIVDNEKASINVGQEIPLISSQGDVDDRTGFNSRSRVERRQTGVTLEVTPQIQEGDFVSMLLLVKVEDPVRSDIGLDPNDTGATIARSALDTTVVIGDGKTGIVGGLLRESLAHTINQVPVLGDLPLLGWLFRSKGNSRAKQNLVIMLSPHIIKQSTDVERLSNLRMDQFKYANIDAIFEKGLVKKLGGKREQRKIGPVRRGEGREGLSGDYDRGRLRKD